MMLGNILLYFLSIIFILTGVLSYGFALESTRECGRMIVIGMIFGAIPDFIPFFVKRLETLTALFHVDFLIHLSYSTICQPMSLTFLQKMG